MLVAHIRSFFARHRAAHWVLVIGLAGVAAALVTSQSAALDRERRGWGTSRTVWVATADLAPGDPALARAVSAPNALIAPTAATDDPSGSVALRSVSAGEVLVSADVGEVGELVAADRRRVAVAADETTLPVAIGDVVDVIDVGAGGAVVATGATVVQVTSASVVVAVAAAAAPAVAAATIDRRAVLVAHG